MRTGRSRRPVWLLAAANGISATGSLAAYTALTYEVYRSTGSPYWVSAAAFASFALAGAAAPVAGWLADRYDRRRVMIGSDLAAAVVYLAAAALASSPLALIALTALGAAAQAPFRPASMAALPNVAAPEDLNWANGLLGSTLSAGIVAGPVVGGLLLSATGASGAFLANAASFVLSAVIVSFVRGKFQPEGATAERPKVDRGSGYRLAMADPVLRTVLIVEALFTLGFGIGIAGDAPLASDLGTGPGGYAAIITAWGVGQVLAGLAMTRWPARTPRADLRALGGGLALMAIAMFATAALPAALADRRRPVHRRRRHGRRLRPARRRHPAQRARRGARPGVRRAGRRDVGRQPRRSRAERDRDRDVRRPVGLRGRRRAGGRGRGDRDRDQARITTGVPVGASFMIRTMSSLCTRMQPFEARVPIRLGAFVPWMAMGLPAAQPWSASE